MLSTVARPHHPLLHRRSEWAVAGLARVWSRILQQKAVAHRPSSVHPYRVGVPVVGRTVFRLPINQSIGRTTIHATGEARAQKPSPAPQEQSHHSHSGAHPLPTPTSPPPHGNSFSCLLSIAASRGGRQPLSTRRWRPPARPRIRLRVVAHSSQLAVRASAGSAPATRSSI